jgi:hypothetical protein
MGWGVHRKSAIRWAFSRIFPTDRAAKLSPPLGHDLDTIQD